MKSFTKRQLELLTILGDGACHNGNELGDALQVSRTAIWKQIKQLSEIGVPIETIALQGYRLPSSFKFLDDQVIANYLAQHNVFNYKLHVVATVDSTNSYLRKLPASSLIASSQVTDVCCAEAQTQGRGRFGRQWESPFGKNIYCSSRWTLHCDITWLSGLSLVVSLAIYSALRELVNTDEIRIKWPNDILWRDKKICGTLIEISAESHGTAEVIIGIGINVNSSHKDIPWRSLAEIFDQQFDRNELVSMLLVKLDVYMQRFMEHGFSAFTSEWEGVDYLLGKEITLSHPTGPISGEALGVNEQGQLLIKDKLGKINYLSSGDTTLGSGGG